MIIDYSRTNVLFWIKKKFQHKKFNKGNSTIGYYKFVYQLIIHCYIPYLAESDKFHVRIDDQTASYSLSELKKILNNGAKKKYNGFVQDPVRSVEPRDSRKSRLIQMADLLTGAIRFRINQQTLEENNVPLSDAKIMLAKYVCEVFGVDDRIVFPPYRNTPRNKKFFSIWHLKLSD